MDQPSLESTLADLCLPAIHYLPSTDSTNEEAWRWIDAGAPHRGLVIADEQTAGRGRFRRRWVTTAGSGLAFSLILRSPPFDPEQIHLLTGLGALAICKILQDRYDLLAQIKWPNDILLDQQKAGGVLVEARWDGAMLKAAVIGIGINVAPGSVSQDNLPVEGLGLPATCIEAALGRRIDRLELLHHALHELFYWLPRLAKQEFLREWEDNLAYNGQWVELSITETGQSPQQEPVPARIQTGRVVGLSPQGALMLQNRSGEILTVQVGEIHLKPIASGYPDLPLK